MKLYLVGGAVRDYALGVKGTKDYDFAVEADSYKDMVVGLRAAGATIWQERLEFVTVRAQFPVVLGSFGGLLPTGSRVVDADFTLCRAETQYSDLRHPDTVTPATLDVDLSRRDFTMNAMAVGENGQWHDPYNGWDDAEDHVLKTVGHPQDRFTEDPLRMLRALRFAIKYNLRFNATLAAVLDDRRLLRGIETLPAERVREELNKAFSADSYRTMYYLMTRFPELGAAVATYHPNLKLKVVQEGM